MSLSRLIWQIQIPEISCDIHDDPVVWEVHPHYITSQVDFTIRFWFARKISLCRFSHIAGVARVEHIDAGGCPPCSIP